MTAPTSPEAQRAAQQREYGTYIATEAINIGGARAFNVGDAVPVSHVESGAVSKDSVAKSTTKAAAAAVENGA